MAIRQFVVPYVLGQQLRLGIGPVSIASHPRTRVVTAALVVVTTACSREELPETTVALTPTASVQSDAFTTHIAAISDDLACVPDTREFRIMCYDRSGKVHGVWGREGEGPGEFQDLMQVRRWPQQRVAVFGIGGRMTVFEPTGNTVAEMMIPRAIMVGGIDGTRVFGLEARLGGGGLRLVELDAESGEIVWERSGYTDISANTTCGRKDPGVPTPQGGWVFPACGNELVFLADRDDQAATVLQAPNYVEELPNARDIQIMRSNLESPALQGSFMVPAPSRREQYIRDYAARPKDWFMGGHVMKFDRRKRLWIGTRHDHSDYSYLDVWTGMDYVGSVRVRDRLIGFDIVGSTLVTVVRRRPARDGIPREAIDWYNIGEVEFGS